MGERYDPGRYARAVGDYDALYPGDTRETAAAIELLADLIARTETKSVLEFGIGTGRIAIPLRQRGIEVHGIDGSRRMRDTLHGKDGGAEIPVIIGDYRTARVPGRQFGVVLLVFNGVFDPRGLAAQLDIFANAAAHLVPGGFFVVETWVMTPEEQNGEWSLLPRFVGHEHLELQLSRYDIDSNRIERTLVHIRSGPPTFVTVADTYASPGQLDVMAEASGFDRDDRHQDWSGTPFTSSSRHSVGIYRRRGPVPTVEEGD